MSRRANVVRHGQNHACGGSDPIPGICDFVKDSGSGTYRDCVLANPHLVAFWPGDESSGNLVDRVAGVLMTPSVDDGYPVYGVDGPFTDTAVEIQGTEGFTGTSAWFETSMAAFTSIIGGTHHWSVESWIYPTSYATTSQNTLLRSWDGGSSSATWQVIIQTNGKMRAIRKLIFAESSAAIPLNTWTHWRATYDGSVVKLYINGVLDNTSSSDTSSFSTLGSNLYWGNAGDSPTFFWAPFEGRMSDLAMYDTDVDTFCPTVTTSGPGSESADAGMALLADGSGGLGWDWPTKVDGTRYGEILTGTGLTSTDNADGTVTVAATAFDVSTATEWWFPLIDSDGTAVLDGDGSIIPTLIPL